MKMNNYILTGASGAGKTSILRQLEVEGYPVVEEAETDVIYLENTLGTQAPWQSPNFIETIAKLQILRRQFYVQDAHSKFFDRSPFCTAALAVYMGYGIPKILLDEIEYVKAAKFFHDTVFFIENLGFIQQTEARKISFDEALRFEKIHRDIYLQHGFYLVDIPKDTLINRVNRIRCAIA